MAQNMAGAFVAGESPHDIADDFGKSEQDVYNAIRFFMLKSRGNKTINDLYQRYQIEKVGVAT